MEIFLSSCLCIFISNILKIILLSYSHQLYLCNFFVKRFLYTYTCIRMYVHTQMYEPICNSKAAVFPKITVCNEIFFPERWQSPNIRTYVRTYIRVYQSLFLHPFFLEYLISELENSLFLDTHAVPHVPTYTSIL